MTILRSHTPYLLGICINISILILFENFNIILKTTELITYKI